MKRPALLLVATMLALPAHAAMDWASLWRNADQRGEQLLQKGDAAAAARTFADPRRRAYAESRAGQHEAAARDWSAFDDGDSQYNRANALARSGKLEEALKAYDAALARNPGDPDARHNRDLVAQALQQQKQQAPQQSGNGQSGNQKNSNDGSGKDQPRGKDGKDGNDGNDGKDGSKPQQPSQSDSGSGKGGPSNQAPSSQDQQGKSGQAAGSQNPAEHSSPDKGQNPSASSGQGSQQQSAHPAQDQQAQSTSQTQPQASGASSPGQANPGDDRQQAQQDAAAGLKPADRNGPHTPASAATALQEGGKPGGDPIGAGPVSEQKLAEDQWLRRIPDDPGGLLRRKFMIEHMLKQQQDSQDHPP